MYIYICIKYIYVYCKDNFFSINHTIPHKIFGPISQLLTQKLGPFY